MAGEIKISALPLAGAAADADVTAGVQSGTTVKQTNSALATYMDSKLQATGNYLLSANNLSDLKNAATARTNLGLGTAAVEDIEFFTLQQAWDVSAPKEIKFTVGEGLAFLDSADGDVFIINEAFTVAAVPFLVSENGTDGMTVIATDDPTSTIFEIKSTTQGSRPFPSMTTAQKDAINLTTAPAGWGVFDTDQKTINFYDGSETQQVLSAEHVGGTGTVTVTNNGDGTITINGSGEIVPDAAYSSFSTQNNAIATVFALQNTFYPIYLGASFAVDQSSDFTNSFLSIGGMSTPVMTYTGTATQFFNVNIGISVRGAVVGVTGYVFSIFIRQSGGTIVPTQYREIVTVSDLINFLAVAPLTANVSLSTGDAVFVEVQNISNTNSIYAAYSAFSITSLAGSITSTDSLAEGANNLYLSENGGTTLQSATGSITNQHLPVFSGTSGLIEDSGIGLSDIDFQYVYENSPDFPDASIDLDVNGEFAITYPVGEVSLLADDSGMYSTLGLHVAPLLGTEHIRFLQTTNPTSTLAEMVSTTRGVLGYPAMTSAQAAAISGTKPVGLGFYNTDTNTLGLWTGSVFTYLMNSTGAQTIGGTKTFSSNIVGNLTGTASIATTGSTVVTSTNASFYPLFVASSSNSNQVFNLGSSLTFNPATNTLTTTGLNLSGLTASSMVVTDGSKNLASASLPLGINAIVTSSTSTQAMSLQTRYIVTYSGGQMVGTLPAATGSGKTVDIIGASGASSSGWRVNAAGSDTIQFNATVSAGAGNVVSTTSSATDCATFIDSASGKWIIYPVQGLNLTVT